MNDLRGARYCELVRSVTDINYQLVKRVQDKRGCLYGFAICVKRKAGELPDLDVVTEFGEGRPLLSFDVIGRNLDKVLVG